MTEKYNGWTNWDTWATKLWLDNEKKNYDRLSSMDKNELLDLGVDELQLFEYGDDGDDIDWTQVNVPEIIESLLEDYE
jgi:hypothetical protein